jgi:FKBP-type peptidyl-prolyl cis-trans isomerase
LGHPVLLIGAPIAAVIGVIMIAVVVFALRGRHNGPSTLVLVTPSPTPTPAGQTAAPSPPTSPPSTNAPFTTDASGLQIATIQDGTGAPLQVHDTVTVNYTGWIQGGGLFDSSMNAGRTPIQFVLGEGDVIRAWDEAVAQMKVGGLYRIIAPPDLGYGAAGSPPYIPSNATLIFDITVLSSQPPSATP